MEDTFLADAVNKFPNSIILINCDTHKSPAVFFSKQQEKYKCFRCLIEEQDLIYIDKKFKKEMEQFERIKLLTADIIKSKSEQTQPMKKWKSEIRKCLIGVRDTFIQWIDSFTNKFVDSLKNLEKSHEMMKFQGADR